MDGPEYLTELLTLHRLAGSPSTRQIAALCPVSHTTINHALRGDRVVAPKSLAKIFEALGGELDIERNYPQGHGQFRGLPAPSTAELLSEILSELIAIRLLLDKGESS